MAIIERPDMPRSFLNLPGANPYNLCLMFITLNSMLAKSVTDNLKISNILKILFCLYFIVFLVAFVRMYFDMDAWYELMDRLNAPHPSNSSLVVDFLLDPIKFILPGLLLVFGTKTPEQGRFALFAIVAMGALLALQVIRVMMPGLLGADDLASRALRVIDRDIGYHRVGISTILSMITSGVFGLFVVFENKTWKKFTLVLFFFLLLSLALTGGRAGLAACVCTCVVLGIFKYKKILVLGPLVGLLLVPIIPGLQERILEGFGEGNGEVNSTHANAVDDEGRDLYAITSGRAVVWPVIVNSIQQAPWVGYGAEAMIRAGITMDLYDVLNAKQHGFSHPHNMYLRIILDSGVLGALVVLAFYIYIGFLSYRDFQRAENQQTLEVGAMAFGMIGAYLLCGVGSGTFFPETNTVMLWAIIGLFVALHWRSFEKVNEVVDAEISDASMSKPLWLKLRVSQAQN